MNSRYPEQMDGIAETLVLYYYGELSPDQAAALEKEFRDDPGLEKDYQDLKGFLDSLPQTPLDAPGDQEWNELRASISEFSVREKARRSKAQRYIRLRVVWAAAVYILLALVGLQWWGGMSLKPSPLVLQVYAGDVIHPGSNASVRIIARTRETKKPSKEEKARFKKQFLPPGWETQHVEEEPADEAKGALPSQQGTAGAAANDQSEAPQEIVPKVRLEYSEPSKKLIEESWRLYGYVPNVPVRVALVSDSGSDLLYRGKTGDRGTVDESFLIPDKVGNNPRLLVEAKFLGRWQAITEPVRIEDNLKFILSVDKQIYRPGQTIHMRVIATDETKKKVSEGTSVFFQVAAPDGTVVARKQAKTSKWGIASADIDLADEVKLGEYRISVTAGTKEESLNVRVDNYTLPDIKIEFTPDQPWVKPGDALTGRVKASYFTGVPVSSGTVSIDFSYYDVDRASAGKSSGQLSASGEYRFSVTVPERMFALTPYEFRSDLYADIQVRDGAGESASLGASVPVSKYKYVVSLMPEAGIWHTGVDNYVYFTISNVDKTPFTPAKIYLETATSPKNELIKLAPGLYAGLITAEDTIITPGIAGVTVRVTCYDDAKNLYEFYFTNLEYGSRKCVSLHTDKAYYTIGDTAKVKVLALGKEPPVYLDAIAGRQTLFTQSATAVANIAEFTIPITPEMTGEVLLRAYAATDNPQEDKIAESDSRMIIVGEKGPSLDVNLSLDRADYAPGSEAKITAKLTGPDGKPVAGAVGLGAVDQKVLALSGDSGGLENVYFSVLTDLLDPRIEFQQADMDAILAGLPSPDELAAVISAASPGADKAALKGNMDYTYDAVVRGIAGRESAMEEEWNNWYRLSQSSAQNETERVGLTREKTRHSMGVGLPLILLLLFALLFVLTVMQHTAFPASRLSRAEWKRYRLFTLLSIIPLVVVWVGAFIPPLSALAPLASVAGFLFAWGAAIAVSQHVNLYWMKSLVLAALYFVLSAWLYVIGRGQVDWVGFVGGHASGIIPPALFAATVLIVLLCQADNVEDFVTGKTVSLGRLMSAFALLMLVSTAVGVLGQAALDTSGGYAKTVAKAERGSNDAKTGAGAAPKMAEKGPAPGIPPSAAPARKAPYVRRWFPETLLWVPEIVTDESGVAEYSLKLGDNVTTWNVSAIGSDSVGHVAAKTEQLAVKSNFYINLDSRLSLTRGDSVRLPVVVHNSGGGKENVIVELAQADWFKLDGPAERAIVLEAGRTGAVSFPVTALSIGKHNLSISAKSSSGAADALQVEVSIEPDGKEFVTVVNGCTDAVSASPLSAQIPPDAVPGSASVTLRLFPNVHGQMVDGIAGITSAPSAGLEQAASLVLSSSLLSGLTDRASQETSFDARLSCELGYQRLISLGKNAPDGGFSMFASGLPDLIGTAYALMALNEASKSMYADPTLIKRTERFLLSSAQPGAGIYKGEGKWYEAAGASSEADLAINAYIVWALASAGVDPGEMFNAVEYVKQKSNTANDPYVLAICLNALDALGENDDKTEFIAGRLAGLAVDGAGGARHWETKLPTLTFARGEEANLETTALAAYPLAVSKKYSEFAGQAVPYLLNGKRADGTWGNSAATALSLRMLLSVQDELTYKGGGTVRILVNGQEASKVVMAGEDAQATKVIDLSNYLTASGKLDVEIDDRKDARLYYQLETRYALPWQELKEIAVVHPFELSVKYDKSDLKVNDLAGVEVTAKYVGPGRTGPIAIDIGVPPGFAVVRDDLDALVAGGIIGQYDLKAGRLSIFVDGMKRDDRLAFRYRVRALYPVTATVPGSGIHDISEPDSGLEVRPSAIRVV